MTTNIQLEEAAKKLKLKNFRGVIMRNEIVKMKPIKQLCGILGSKTSRENNMHWCAWWKDGETKYYFDSFGLTPTIEIVKYLKTKKVFKSEADLKSPIIYSTFQIQQFNEENCGQWCLYVLNRLNKGDEYEDIVLDVVNEKTY
jgi:hypothetical protein